MEDELEAEWAQRWQRNGSEIYRMLPDGEPWEENDDTREVLATFHGPAGEENCKSAMAAIEAHKANVKALLAFITSYQPGVSKELDEAHRMAVTAVSDMQNGTHYPS